MEKYLKTTNRPNFQDWHNFSGLNFLESSQKWNVERDKIIKQKRNDKRKQKKSNNADDGQIMGRASEVWGEM